MTIAGLVATALVVYSYAFVVAGIVDVDGDADGGYPPQCLLYERYLPAMTVLNNVDTVTTLIIPSIVIVTMNVTIARKVVAFYKRRSAMSADAVGSPATSRYVVARGFPTNGAPSTHTSLPTRTYRDALRSRNQIRITKMLLFVSTVFITLNLPSHAVRLHVFVVHLLDPGFVPTERLEVGQQYAQLVYNTNFSINFFLYSLAGAGFRKSLRRRHASKQRNCSDL
ncbi:PREDICTED: uncharacterized protein LOC106819236 [Priapulus caudatus]|uniref:Uncharacterized protein LOC106819236 n=1 Tax=Priapulus caudatus TaxID=37621 RepID=A0ABM1F4J6_PRICU|nr:PREDICTED: uncharacterized protein LOC106819236 [Priapulus caudatus]